MMPEQEQELAEKLKRLGYSSFEVMPGQDGIEMLYMQGKLICSVDYALSLPEEKLKELIDETLAVSEAQ